MKDERGKCTVCGHVLSKHTVYLDVPEKRVCTVDNCRMWTDCWKGDDERLTNGVGHGL